MARPVRGGFQDSRLRIAIIVLVAAKLSGLVLVVDWSGRAFDAVDLPKSQMSRGIEWILAALIAITIVRYGIGVIPRTTLHLAVGAFVVVSAITTLTAEDRYIALYGAPGRFLGLTFVADMAILYLATAVGMRRQRDWIFLGIVLATTAVIAVGYGTVQRVGMDPLLWTIDPRDRPFSTLGNPDVFGHFLSVMFGGGVGVLVGVGPRQRLVFALAVVFCLLTLGMMSFVATRGSLAGVAGAALGAGAVLTLRGHVRQVRSPRGSVAALVAVAAMIVGLLVTPLGARARNVVADNEAFRSRAVVYEGAFAAFRDRPIVGWGPDNIGVLWPRYRQAGSAELSGPTRTNNSAHDWILQIAATTGLLGIASMFAVLFFSYRALFRRAAASDDVVVAPLVVASLSYWANGLVSVGSVAVDWVPWLTFGAAAALSPTQPSRSVQPKVAAFVIVAASAIAVFGALNGLNALGASQDASRARQDTSMGQAAGAIAAASSATARDPGRADYWNELGRAFYVARRWEESASAFTAATERARYEAAYLDNLALARLQQGLAGDDRPRRSAQALEAAQRAAEIDPNSAPANARLAEIAFALQAYDVASAAVRRALSLFPADHTYHLLKARIELAQGRWADAEASARQGLDIENTIPLQVARARALIELGRSDEALLVLRDILRRDPGNGDAKALLARLGQG